MDHLVATHIFTCPHCVTSALPHPDDLGQRCQPESWILCFPALCWIQGAWSTQEAAIFNSSMGLFLFPWRKCARYGGARRYNPSEARFMGMGSKKYPSGSLGMTVRVSGDSFYCFYSLVPEVTHSFYWGLAIQHLYWILEDSVPSL